MFLWFCRQYKGRLRPPRLPLRQLQPVILLQHRIKVIRSSKLRRLRRQHSHPNQRQRRQRARLPFKNQPESRDPPCSIPATKRRPWLPTATPHRQPGIRQERRHPERLRQGIPLNPEKRRPPLTLEPTKLLLKRPLRRTARRKKSPLFEREVLLNRQSNWSEAPITPVTPPNICNRRMRI
jgi:hypothetical protein